MPEHVQDQIKIKFDQNEALNVTRLANFYVLPMLVLFKNFKA